MPSGEGEINNKHLGRMRFKEEKRDTRHLLGILVYPWYLDFSQERDHGKKFWVTTKIKKWKNHNNSLDPGLALKHPKQNQKMEDC